MSLLDKVFRFRVFSRLVKSIFDAETVQVNQEIIRKDLDARLDVVTRATLNGEDDWFLRLVKNDPKCVLDVVKECNKK